MGSSFFHTHVHSHYSTLDGTTPVEQLVSRAVELKFPGMSLTDHGVMSGVFEAYKGLRKAGLLPYPGLEAYLVSDPADKTAKRYHATMFALDTSGYEALVQLSTRSHKRENFHYKPLVGLAHLQEMSDQGLLNGLVCTSGCWYGWVQQAIEERPENYRPHMVRRLKLMASIFPHYYVEIQHHSRDDDDWVPSLMHELAVEIGLPVIITQDSHYCFKRQAPLHNMMKALAYGGDPGDSGFPGDGYHFASTEWMKVHYEDTPEIWDDAESTFEFLVDNNRVKLPFLDNYQYHVPKIVTGDSLKRLRRICESALADLSLTRSKRLEYTERLEYELAVIEEVRMADYFHLVSDVCNECHRRGIMINVRGSANGSLVCYLTGIIELDPIEWELSFDRFMSVDRERPPDVDVDIEDARREEMYEYISSKHEAYHISTYARLGVNDEGGGGIMVSFMGSTRRRLGDDKFFRRYGKIKHIDDLRPIEGDEFVDLLEELGREKIYKSYGTHAAGILLGTKEHPIHRWMPLMLVSSSNTTVTQMTMGSAEDGGWTKLDLLGSATLTVARMALEMTDTDMRLTDIPLGDKEVMALIRKGRSSTGIFQLEGGTMARGCREMKVKTIHDLIVVNALYRPATINAGHVATYLKNRKDPSAIEYMHPIFEKVLGFTYGIPVYQEQVMSILRELGFSSKDLNRMLKAIKASNDKVAAAQATFQDLRKMFHKLAVKAGMTDQEANEAWDFIATFSDYSFNRAHATAYGLLGYRTAWIKHHYSLEFHTALLRKWGGTKNEARYAVEAKHNGHRLLQPDVNISGPTWTIDRSRKAIRKGLSSIKGIGVAAANEITAHAPYKSIQDLIARTNSKAVTGGKDINNLKGVLKALDDAGALESLKE